MVSITALELHHLAKEMECLKGAKIEKVFQNQDMVSFQLHVKDIGKQYLNVFFCGLVFLTETKAKFPEEQKFAFSLRKHISGKRIDSVYQQGFERLLVIDLGTDRIFIELLRPVNIILTRENKVVVALKYKSFGTRLIRPNIDYTFPQRDVDAKHISVQDLGNLIEKSEKDLETCLAVDLGLGGKYAKEVTKNCPGSSDIALIHKEIKSLFEKSINPHADKNKASLFHEEGMKDFATLSKAFSFIAQNMQKPNPLEDKKKQLMSVIAQQEQMVEGLEAQFKDNTRKGELIYENYEKLSKLKGKGEVSVDL